jgi:hypothetical protein
MGQRRISARELLQLARELSAILCVAALTLGSTAPAASQTQQSPQAAEQAAVKLPPDQLDSLVAPIALYPDPMLSQVVVASTYPLEVIQLMQWLDQHKDLKDKALADAAEKQDWDPSIESLAGLPDVVKLLSENIKWTTDLGNAFLTQQNDVMEAVQRMRKKAQDNGNLKSKEQQKVEVKTVENKQVIVVEQANPQIVYVPTYNPTVVYGAPAYAYPPIAYPPPGYYAAGMAISFGAGVEGYSTGKDGFHGYYFKILKGQGPAALMGQSNYVIEGIMIGGFALVGVPVEYRVSGVKTFIVSNDGVVYQKDLGPDSVKIVKEMELYNPDKTWQPTDDEWPQSIAEVTP